MKETNHISTRLKLELDILASELEASEGEDDDRPLVLLGSPEDPIWGSVRETLSARFDVRTERRGDHLLNRASDLLPDCIVAAMRWPAQDGLALGRRLQTDPSTAGIPLVLFSEQVTDAERVEAFVRSGADALLTSSVSLTVLQARVSSLVAKRERLVRTLAARFARAPDDTQRRDGGGLVADGPTTETAFVRRIRTIVRGHLSDSDFGVAELASTAGLSRSQLYRRLKQEAADREETTPSGLLRVERLRRARALLRYGEESVTQVCYAVGFESPSHFSRQFRARYGCTPSEVGTPATKSHG